MDLSIENFIKSATGIVTFGTAILTLLAFIFNKNIKIITINEIDQLFLEKSQQTNLQIWRLIIGQIPFIFLNVSVTALLYFIFENLQINTTLVGTIAFVLLIIWGIFLTKIIISALHASKTTNINREKFSDTFMLTIISGTFVHSILFSYSLFIDPSAKTIITIFFFLLMVFLLYSIIINKHKIKIQTEYSVSIISEAKVKLEKLKHGYVIDNKRTIYFSEYYKNTDVFFICDFDSKVYLKYTKIINANKTEDNTDTVTTQSN